MIRTEVVTLTAIAAIAFRQKLTAGGSGITILRFDVEQPGRASISKTSGTAIPTANTSADLYPAAAFREAIELTSGMPYTKRGGVRLNKQEAEACPPEPGEAAEEQEIVVDSRDYQKLVAHYTDKNGKLSYDLIDRDLIKFAHTSKTVKAMLEEKVTQKKIRNYIVSSKFRSVTGNKKLTEEEALKMAELLDEASPRSVYKALDAELRRMNAASKRK